MLAHDLTTIKSVTATIGSQRAVRRIGPHLPLRMGLLQAAERAHAIGATAVQVFTDNPTAWRRRSAPPPELPEFRARLAAYDIGPIAVHASYLINLCGADIDFWRRSVATLASELVMGAAYGASFVNVHVGSHKGLGREQGMRQLVLGLRAVADAVIASQAESGSADPLPMIVLENSAGSGDGVGSSIEDLADIDAMAQGEGIGGYGFCLDTAHLWAAGYCIDGDASVAALLTRVQDSLGADRVVMLHLNDARTGCGSRVDRHQHIGAGMIGESGIRAVLEHPWLSLLPTFLETPGMESGFDAVNLERVRLLLAGEALPDLPPEAFAPRVGRRRKQTANA
jgi:deoxyribonuclease IV